MRKQNKGITLIALIITIIVMLILVGVTINVTLNGGLFEKAKDAALLHNAEVLKEELLTTSVSLKAAGLSNSKKFKIDMAKTEAIYDQNPNDFFEYDHVVEYSGEDGTETHYFGEMILKELEDNNITIPNTYTGTHNDVRYFKWLELITEGSDVVTVVGESTFRYTIDGAKYKNDKEVTVIIEITYDKTSDSFHLSAMDLEYNPNGRIYIDYDEVMPTKNEYIAEIKDGVPIPEGFTYVTGSKNSGMVIEDDSTENQFVWVPVVQNTRVCFDLLSSTKINTIVIEDIFEDSSLNQTIQVNGINYKNEFQIPNNTYLKITVNYENGTSYTQWLCANTNYQLDNGIMMVKFLVDDFLQSFMEGGLTYEEAVEECIKEMKENAEEAGVDIALETDVDIIRYYRTTLAAAGSLTSTDNVAELSSVKKYGGYYIGRYEASGSSVKSGNYPSEGISYTSALSNVQGMYGEGAAVVSILPSGTAWDYIGKWLLNTNTKTFSEIYLNSEDWGNYSNGSLFGWLRPNTSEKVQSGRDSRTRVKGIYDLAGNVSEWTTEISTDKDNPTLIKNVARGGSYKSYIGCFSGSNYYDPSASLTNSPVGYRPLLYIRIPN